MIKNQILVFGLTRLEMQTLYTRFPLLYQFYQVRGEDFDDLQKVEQMVTKSACLFINPKKLTTAQLNDLITFHTMAATRAHTSILVFTATFTREQKGIAEGRKLHRVDLKTRVDRTLRDTVKIVRKGTMPCWSSMAKMKANMFDDGWYLISFETSGPDPLEDDIFSITIAYMANYKIQMTWKLNITPDGYAHDDNETMVDFVIEKKVTKQGAIDFLNDLRYPAPVIFKQEEYDLPFMQVLYRSCGQNFRMPYILLDGLCAIVFGYLLPKRSSDILNAIDYEKDLSLLIENSRIEEMYYLTLATFKNLKTRYDVHAPGHFQSLYFFDSYDDG